MNLVSIILPYYKKKKFILKTIESVINQKFKNFELIIIYDDSDKSDLKYLREICKKNNRIKILINKINHGAGFSRNKGLKRANGKYVAFLDADDIWHPNKINFQLNYMIRNKIDISHTSYKIINNHNKIIGFRKAKKLEYNQLLKSCDIGLSTVMIKKSILKKDQFPKLKTKEDYVLWLKLTKKKFIFYPIKSSLASWRKLDNSLSSSVIQKMFDGYTVYRVFMKQSVIKSLLSLFNLSINFLKK